MKGWVLDQSETDKPNIQEEEAVRVHPLFVQMEKERIDREHELKNLQHEFTELTEYLNKLEPSYNQSLEFITHLEDIISRVMIIISIVISVPNAQRHVKNCYNKIRSLVVCYELQTR